MPRLTEVLLNNAAMSRVAGRVYAHPWGQRLYLVLLSNRKEAVRFAKFATVGAIGTVVDFGVLNLLILGFGFSKFWANTCSFSAAVVSNFIWNRLWTFPESREKSLVSQLVQFSIVSIGGYVINQVIFLGLDSMILHVWGALGYNVAKATATIVVLFWNFGMNRVWTYRGIE